MKSGDSSPLTARGRLLLRLAAKYDELQHWERTGAAFGISGGMAWRIVNEGYEPKDNKIRVKLGLPEQITITVSRDKKGRFSGSE